MAFNLTKWKESNQKIKLQSTFLGFEVDFMYFTRITEHTLNPLKKILFENHIHRLVHFPNEQVLLHEYLLLETPLTIQDFTEIAQVMASAFVEVQPEYFLDDTRHLFSFLGKKESADLLGSIRRLVEHIRIKRTAYVLQENFLAQLSVEMIVPEHSPVLGEIQYFTDFELAWNWLVKK